MPELRSWKSKELGPFTDEDARPYKPDSLRALMHERQVNLEEGPSSIIIEPLGTGAFKIRATRPFVVADPDSGEIEHLNSGVYEFEGLKRGAKVAMGDTVIVLY